MWKINKNQQDLSIYAQLNVNKRNLRERKSLLTRILIDLIKFFLFCFLFSICK